MSGTDIPGLDEWLDRVAATVGYQPDGVDVADLLNVARDVAHHQVRPGAPTSTFLIGAALGVWEEQQRAAGSPVTSQQRSAKLHELSLAVQELATSGEAHE